MERENGGRVKFMGWIDYYILLDKYEGDIKKATYWEVFDAMLGSRMNPDLALAEAKRAYNNRGLET